MNDYKIVVTAVGDLGKKDIYAYKLEIANAIIDRANELASEEQKEDAYNLACVQFENSEDSTIGANVYAKAAIMTIIDEKYKDAKIDDDEINNIFNEKLDLLLS